MYVHLVKYVAALESILQSLQPLRHRETGRNRGGAAAAVGCASLGAPNRGPSPLSAPSTCIAAAGSITVVLQATDVVVVAVADISIVDVIEAVVVVVFESINNSKDQ